MGRLYLSLLQRGGRAGRGGAGDQAALALLDEGEPVHREAFRAFREATLQACHARLCRAPAAAPPLRRPRCAGRPRDDRPRGGGGRQVLAPQQDVPGKSGDLVLHFPQRAGKASAPPPPPPRRPRVPPRVLSQR